MQINFINLTAKDSEFVVLSQISLMDSVFNFLNISLRVQFCLPRYNSNHIFVKITWKMYS